MEKKMVIDEDTCEDIQAHLGRAASHIRHAMELLSDCSMIEHEKEEEKEPPEKEEQAESAPNVVQHDRVRKQIILRY